jgi:hypothetical protein
LQRSHFLPEELGTLSVAPARANRAAGLVRSADTRASDDLQITSSGQRRALRWESSVVTNWRARPQPGRLSPRKCACSLLHTQRTGFDASSRVTAIAHARPTSEHAIITYADARVIRPTGLARLTTFGTRLAVALVHRRRRGLCGTSHRSSCNPCPRHSRFTVI